MKLLRYFIWGAIKLTILTLILTIGFPFWIVLFCVDIGSGGQTEYFEDFFDRVMDWFTGREPILGVCRDADYN